MRCRPLLNSCVLACAALAGAAPCLAAGDEPASVLLAGPLPVAAPLFSGAAAALPADFVAELDARALWPEQGYTFAWSPGRTGRFARVDCGAGGIELPACAERSVFWVACYALLERRAATRVAVEGAGDLLLLVDGGESGHAGAPGDERTVVEAQARLERGLHRLLLRVEREAQAASALRLRLEPPEECRVRIGVDPRHALTSYDELREATGLSGLELSPDGALLALNLRQRRGADEQGTLRLDVIETSTGRTVAPFLGGAGARAVAWREDGGALLFRNGESLRLWNRASGGAELVLEAEPGLGAVSWSADGSFLVFSSTRGAPAEKGGVTRRVELREKLSDWPTRPHLHLLMLESGARRRLALPGDWVQDAFALLPGNRGLLYLRSVPLAERPWFCTEFRLLDLASGADRLLATLRMGFENRPGLSGLAVAPDGSKAAFVAPPAELRQGAAEVPSAFDPDLFVMDLAGGSWRRLSEGLDAAVGGRLSWASDSRSIRFAATAGSRSKLVHAAFAAAGAAPRFSELAVGGERIHDISITAAGDYACVASSPDRLPALYARIGPGEAEPRLLLDPNERLARRLLLAAPRDASFTGPDGSRIEGWLYWPEEPFARAPGARLPLIASYYGGATPTLRGFDELDQFLVGRGYALFVCNPRGACGYGEAFAASHVAEWGERAGADVLAGVESVLAAHADLDPERVGCCGGSYGGFLTMWLIAHSERFAAAVSLYGISNVASYLGDGMWGYTYGDQAINHYPWSDPAWFVAHSPLFQADHVTAPLLLLHGGADVNVPPGESEQMFTALRLLNRTAELVLFPGEDHGIAGSWKSRAEHRTMLAEWFDRFLRSEPAAWNERWE